MTISGETLTPSSSVASTPADEMRKMRQQAVIAPIVLDERQKLRWINNNGLVRTDALADHKRLCEEAAQRWTDDEKRAFVEKLVGHGKNFGAIQMFLDRKSTKDCVRFYYATKKRENYKALLRRQYRKRAKVYRPPEMPRIDELTRVLVPQQRPAIGAMKVDIVCILCKTTIDPLTNPGRILTRSSYEAYGLDQFDMSSAPISVCVQCRLSQGGHGATGGATVQAGNSMTHSAIGGGSFAPNPIGKRKYTFCPVGTCVQPTTVASASDSTSTLTASSAAMAAASASLAIAKYRRPKPTRPLPGKMKLLTDAQKQNMFAIMRER